MGLDDRVRCCPDGLMTDRRHGVRILDATIRDGGLCNNWNFDHDFVRRVYHALGGAGVDIMEIGYWANEPVADAGPWRSCAERDLQKVVDGTGPKIAVMVDVGRYDYQSMPKSTESLVDVVRIATYAHQIEEAVKIAEVAAAQGYEVFCNVMAVTTCTPQQVDGFLERLNEAEIRNVAVVDSFGAMYPHHLRYLIRKYKNWLKPTQRVGVHLHNNQQTAFANTIAAIDEGADFIDATLFGMGRGAGNCPLELLLMYLDDPQHNVRPLLELTETFAQLQTQLHWGYQVPYGITGWLNMHPKSAIVAMGESTAHSQFYDRLVNERRRPQHHRARKEKE